MEKSNIWTKIFFICIALCLFLFIYSVTLEILYWTNISIPHIAYVIRNIYGYIISTIIAFAIIGNLVSKHKKIKDKNN